MENGRGLMYYIIHDVDGAAPVPKPSDNPRVQNETNENLYDLECIRVIRDIEMRVMDLRKKNKHLVNQTKLRDIKIAKQDFEIAGLKRKLNRKRCELFAHKQTLHKLTQANAKYKAAKKAEKTQAHTKAKSIWKNLLDIITPINWK